jgi:hypothetical protein
MAAPRKSAQSANAAQDAQDDTHSDVQPTAAQREHPSLSHALSAFQSELPSVT